MPMPSATDHARGRISTVSPHTSTRWEVCASTAAVMPTDADPNASSASNTECFICLLRLRKFLFRYHGRQSGVTRSCKQCHCVVGAHIVCRDHPSNYPIDVRTGRTRGHRDIACVKRHMPALDTFGGKRAQRAHVLREADSDSNLAEILSRVHIHDLE